MALSKMRTQTNAINIVGAMWRYMDSGYTFVVIDERTSMTLKSEPVQNFYNSHTIELHKMQRHYVTLQLHTCCQSHQIFVVH